MHAIMDLLLHRLPDFFGMQLGFGSDIGGPSVATFRRAVIVSSHTSSAKQLKNRKRRIFNEANFDHERDRWQAHHLQGHGECMNCGNEWFLFCSFHFLSMMIAKHGDQRLTRKSFRHPRYPHT